MVLANIFVYQDHQEAKQWRDFLSSFLWDLDLCGLTTAVNSQISALSTGLQGRPHSRGKPQSFLFSSLQGLLLVLRHVTPREVACYWDYPLTVGNVVGAYEYMCKQAPVSSVPGTAQLHWHSPQDLVQDIAKDRFESRFIKLMNDAD